MTNKSGEPTDDFLLARAAAGDADAFGVLVRRHQTRLLDFARRLLPLGETDAAHDVVQEAFLRLWRGQARYQARGRLVPLLLRIVRSVCVDWSRAQIAFDPSREEVAGPAGGSPQSILEARDRHEAVWNALAALPAEQREVFVLSHFEGLRYHEIADVVGCPPGTVASRKHAAVQSLRKQLAPWLNDIQGTLP